MITTNELREKYLSFFESKGCVRKASDVLVPRWDPSVLFTPAGMNQFKDHFLGRCKLEFTRATTCQKCLRTGDIDNVGRTAFHHTFFEMLGNFSFGDYFKREAINWAWEFLTDKRWLGLEPSKLSVTVYKDDHEAAKFWLEDIKLLSSKVSYMEEDENFWPASAPSLGPDGVCGPCSEIYYETPIGTVEIWNLVFTQFNRVGDPPNNLRPLPSKNIDTGMGLERCAAVLQGVDTNYHIDILRPIVEAAGEIIGVKYAPKDDNGRRLRRITDHIRACTFAVHENVYPGNKEEKYVIRRLLRRAVLDGRQMGADDAFLYKLVPVVAEIMKVPYPELSDTITRVQQVIKSEEDHFIETIDKGLERIERIFAAMKSTNRTQIDGNEIFEMYQTFGFPPELFETLASEQHLSFDWNGFRKEMERHGEVSGSTEKNLLFKNDPLESVKKNNPPTEFVGYDDWSCEGKIVAILVDGKLVDEIVGGTCSLILDKTSFYAEKGGQVGDKGIISNLDANGKVDTIFEVESTQLDGELIIHIGRIRHADGKLKVGDSAFGIVKIPNRSAIERAHTATHLLHYVLRLQLGEHAEQQGSKVSADELRFDFTNPSAIDKATLQKIELQVNELILEADDGNIKEMSIEEARKTGAMMLFGEKYPERVRVVKFGGSIELCGGTHLTNTSQVGLFKIVSESSVSSGTRRIEAITGMKAMERVLHNDALLTSVAQTLKGSPDEVPLRVESLLAEVKKLKRSTVDESSGKQDKASLDAMIATAFDVGKTKVVIQHLNGVTANDVRSLIDALRQRLGSVAVFFAVTQDDDKLMVMAAFTRDLVANKMDANDWVNSASAIINGKGGGRPNMAQAGGRGVSNVPAIIEAAKKWAEGNIER
ncbi:MAG: alanine--tRNA ligase [Planctomycetaceae bacterium]|jgi:alanyl-tRNA synthetase|nr:alanine--tRNA ligase [Planctomycetaceae bacterium]